MYWISRDESTKTKGAAEIKTSESSASSCDFQVSKIILKGKGVLEGTEKNLKSYNCEFLLQDVIEVSQYSLKPSVDNSETFDQVSLQMMALLCRQTVSYLHYVCTQVETLLLQGGTVGVFPEGFTHDGPKVCILLFEPISPSQRCSNFRWMEPESRSELSASAVASCNLQIPPIWNQWHIDVCCFE